MTDEERVRACLSKHAYGGWIEERVDTLVPILVALIREVRDEERDEQRGDR